MTVILLLLLIAQPEPDESSRVVQNLFAQLSEASRLMEDDPEGAIRVLNELLDDPKAQELESRSQTVRVLRDSALYYRGQIQLRQGQAQVVADDMTALLDSKRKRFLARVAGLVGALASPQWDTALGAVLNFPPTDPLNRMDWLPALGLRAQAYKELGQHDKEQADRAAPREILREMKRGMLLNPYEPPDSPPGWLEWMQEWPEWMQDEPWRPGSWVIASQIIAGAFLVMVPIFFLVGLRQRRDAGGTWRRLLWVSLVLAALQTLPLLVAFLLLRWRPAFYYLPTLPLVTLLVFGVNIVRHCSYLAPVKWLKARGAPPLLQDEVVLGRITEIAGRIGVAAPVTRLVRSPTALQTNNALVSGLVAPTMVLYDGILHRLTEDERDAIIAHELAHVANHTFWYWVVSGTACGIAVVVASAFCSIFVAFGLGVALLTGTWLILSRWLELDCDRRAARVIGHRRTASALSKIHADQPFRGLLEFLIGAVSSHPARDQRLAAIDQDAPDDDRPAVEWDARLLGHRRLAAWGAAGLWLSIIVACLVWGYRSPRSGWPALPLVLMDVVLFVLFWLGLRKAARRKRRLQRKRHAWRRRLAWLVPALLAGYLVAQIYGLTNRLVSPKASLFILPIGFLASAVLFLLLSRNKAKKLNLQIVIAIQSGDYPTALALCENSPAVVAGSTELRYNHALIRAVLGRRAEALVDLEKLRRDDPGFKMTLLLLASLYADEREYTRALEVTAQLSHDLPDEPTGPQVAAWLLRKLGRLEEAETRAREVLKMEPRSGLAHLTLAAVALDHGDHAGAREQLAQAERLVPGSVTGALLAAEMALATDDGAEAAVQQAVKAAKNNPLSFAQNAVADMVQRLEACRQPSAG